ncbi:MAG TPA: ABC-F family ATP-binding cassette domain-containing protein [Rhizomicrobium sp.]|nr:ABC-F family ATP-binding cassette domain-containing protein [Rhizomicrobium sp.]
MLVIDNLTIRIAGRDILKGATASLPAGRRVGLVGRNGAGKSTLFKAILGELQADTGAISLPSRWRIGQVAQEAPGTDDTLIDTVLAADEERLALLSRAEAETDPHAIADIHARLDAIDAYSAPARAAGILAGLGFDHEEQRRPCREFSGGWRMRVALAAILFAAPDLLLLDEPTNYLDLEGVLWLEDYLRRYRGTVIVISHDRDLLDNVAEFILHLEHGKLTLYSGDYETFTEVRAMRRANDIAFNKKQELARAHMQAYVDRFRYKKEKARQAQTRLRMIAKLEFRNVPLDEHIAPIRLPDCEPGSPPVFAFDRVSVGYEPGRPVLSDLNLRIDPDDRIALLGQNGNGKSTLAKLLAGKLGSMAGTLTRARKLSIGYFAQHQLDELDGSLTPAETLAHLRPKMMPTELRTRIGAMGLSGDKALTKVGQLSGGERARLMLALATLDKPNFLILDEPTNHLDIDARQELLTALNDYEGAVILISHDRRLIESTMDRLWLVANGTVAPFDGDLDDYRRFLLAGEPPRAEAPKVTKENARRDAAERRRQLKPLKDKVEIAESQIAELNREIAKFDKVLADPLLFARDPAKGASVARKRADALRKLEAAESRWLAANEAYEAAVKEEA